MNIRYVPTYPARILATDPVSRGFGFVILEEDPFRLVEWGVATCRKRRNPHCLFALGRLIERYDPTVLVTESPRDARTLRQQALGAFLHDLTNFLDGSALPLRVYSRREIREAFASTGAITKQDIAELLGRRFPELSWRVPPPRQIWDTEDSRMSIFDALSLAMTHLTSGRERLADAS